MQRYSFIEGNFPREFLLLQGSGCRWKKCKYCDYYLDTSSKPFEVNKNVLNLINGKSGVLDIINSGSAIELDNETIFLLKKIIIEKNISTVWFESHWMYRNLLEKFSKQFSENVTIKWRTGVETFNPKLRNYINKGIPENVTPLENKKYFSGVCLLVGFEGQQLADIVNDIKIAEENFEYFSVNVFIENSTKVKRDNVLINNFIDKIYPDLLKCKKAEILLNNTDLGVG